MKYRILILCTFFIIILIFLPCLSLHAEQTPEDAFQNMMLPGLSGGCYYFIFTETLYYGGAFRFDILYGLESNRKNSSWADRGRWEVYIDVGLFSSTENEEGDYQLLFRYVLGFSLSFETPKLLTRNYLIPYMGLGFGGIYIRETGNGFCVSPFLGINLFSYPNWSLSLETSLFLPTIAFDEFFGICPQINLNFVL